MKQKFDEFPTRRLFDWLDTQIHVDFVTEAFFLKRIDIKFLTREILSSWDERSFQIDGDSSNLKISSSI